MAYLEQYINEQMVPRSLHWEVNPNKGESELESWFKYFNEAGLKFLSFLTYRKKAKLFFLDKEIKEIKEKVALFKNDARYISPSTSLRSTLEKEEGKQKNKKKRKYILDVGDYRFGIVFKWQIRKI